MDSKSEHGSDQGKESIVRYEELRAQALEVSDRFDGGLGWALFVRKGMAAWLRAWREHRTQEKPEHAVSYRPIPWMGQEQQRDVVMVWTGMVMGQLPRRTACTP